MEIERKSPKMKGREEAIVDAKKKRDSYLDKIEMKVGVSCEFQF